MSGRDHGDPRSPSAGRDPSLRVTVVGSGSRFLSGISYYTHRLARALSEVNRVSVILMRQLVPTRLYPGRARVGADLADLDYDPMPVHDGVDWYWIPSASGAVDLLRSERPDVVVFQWWTGSVLHSYLLLAWTAKRMGAKVVIEFHEVLDTGEARIPFVSQYVRLGSRGLMRLADGFIVHSRQDLEPLRQQYRLGDRPAAVIPHGPYDQYRQEDATAARSERGSTRERTADEGITNLLFFGLIRPYKGLEDLIEAFDALPPEEAESMRLTVVGETWEGWTRPAELIEASRYRDRITFVNRYVRDEEVPRLFEEADAVVLPYRRSAASGPLSIAMAHGLPVVTTDVGGLTEAVADYRGALLIPPEDVDALGRALLEVRSLTGTVYEAPVSWDETTAKFQEFFTRIMAAS